VPPSSTALPHLPLPLLLQLFEKYRGGAAPPKELGPSRDYNVDMVPKFMMARGKLVKALIYTSVTKYLEFKAVDGSFVYNKVGWGRGRSRGRLDQGWNSSCGRKGRLAAMQANMVQPHCGFRSGSARLRRQLVSSLR
jgi:hypothetical protein